MTNKSSELDSSAPAKNPALIYILANRPRLLSRRGRQEEPCASSVLLITGTRLGVCINEMLQNGTRPTPVINQYRRSANFDGHGSSNGCDQPAYWSLADGCDLHMDKGRLLRRAWQKVHIWGGQSTRTPALQCKYSVAFKLPHGAEGRQDTPARPECGKHTRRVISIVTTATMRAWRSATFNSKASLHRCIARTWKVIWLVERRAAFCSEKAVLACYGQVFQARSSFRFPAVTIRRRRKLQHPECRALLHRLPEMGGAQRCKVQTSNTQPRQS